MRVPSSMKLTLLLKNKVAHQKQVISVYMLNIHVID